MCPTPEPEFPWRMAVTDKSTYSLVAKKHYSMPPSYSMVSSIIFILFWTPAGMSSILRKSVINIVNSLESGVNGMNKTFSSSREQAWTSFWSPAPSGVSGEVVEWADALPEALLLSSPLSYSYYNYCEFKCKSFSNLTYKMCHNINNKT